MGWYWHLVRSIKDAIKTAQCRGRTLQTNDSSAQIILTGPLFRSLILQVALHSVVVEAAETQLVQRRKGDSSQVGEKNPSSQSDVFR